MPPAGCSPAGAQPVDQEDHHPRSCPPPGVGWARFGAACSVCPLRNACTSSLRGRVVAIHPHEAELAAAHARQRDPDYRATRPRVEHKLAHLLRPRHGGRRARVRGLGQVAQDFKLLAAASTWPASPAAAGRSSRLTGDRAAALLALAQHAELLQPIRHHPPRPSTLRATGIAASLSICVGLSTVSLPAVVARPRQTNTQNPLQRFAVVGDCCGLCSPA
jgi:hypothetical protein